MTTAAPILLVDDQPEVLAAMETQLGGMANIELVPVGSGEEALRQLAVREFALVLLDVNMPGMNGFEVASKIRADAATNQTPIIFFTGTATVDLEFLGYKSGAVDYLRKPIDPLMLRTKVQVFADLYFQRQTVLQNRRYLAHVEELVAKELKHSHERDEQLRVLLVDDRPENLLSLEALLSELDDLVFVKANSGTEALRAVLRNEFAVILLDVQMPGMDGFETADLIHSNPKTKHIPIIFVTAGMKEREYLVRGYEQGAFDYLIKPLEPAIVKSKVRIFCDLHRQRATIEKQNTFLEILTADRTAALESATAELRKSLERYQHLAETQELAARAASLGIWDWDLTTNKRTWSPRMYELYGLTEGVSDIRFESWLTRVHPDDRERCEAALQLALRNERSYDIEFRVQLPDQSIRHIKADGMVTFDAHGKPLRATGINYDITQRKQIEAELHQLNENLEARAEEKTRQLGLAMEKIFETEKLASLGSIVAGVAHELNTPIGNIVMSSSTIDDHLTDLSGMVSEGRLSRNAFLERLQHCKEAAALLTRNARRAGDLVDSFKKVAVDQTSERRRHFDLRDVIVDIVNTLGAVVKSSKTTIEVRVPQGIQVDSYPGVLEQVLSNLILNSIHHGFEGKDAGQITIGGNALQETVEIVYEDNGKGIAPEFHRKIFEPFYTTKLGQGGSGLGMFITRNLVRGSLRGDIQLESDVGKGVRFTLGFPSVTPAGNPEADTGSHT